MYDNVWQSCCMNFYFELSSSVLKCNSVLIRHPHSHCGLGGQHQLVSINFGG